MGCSRKLDWKNDTELKLHTRADLERLVIKVPDADVEKKVLDNWDLVAKPLDGMGSFEGLIARIGAIQKTEDIDLSKKAVVIMCADNGIVAEGVSQSGQEVTTAVARSMGQKRSSVCRMAAVIGADTLPIDIGIRSEEEIEGVYRRKIRCGTSDFLKEPAMTEEDALRAIAVGIETVSECRKRGYRILATGEMGIGNTTTSSAVAAALLSCDASKVTGRGAGLSDAGLDKKRRVIAEALRKYDLYHADALTVLQTVGGLDIAALAGVCIGGALFSVPIVLDGVISMTAALVAKRLAPGSEAYLLPSHKGKEPAVELLAGELGLEPVIDGKLALGEGTGAVMMLALLELSLSVYGKRTTFSDISIKQYKRFDAI